jgi:peptidoglycan hydrolase-like protein with peptidoglycan-binding domain
VTRTRALWAAGGAAALLVVGSALLLADGSDEATATSEVRTARATVERRDLVRRDSFDGTLGYADARVLGSMRGGTVTALAPEGAIVKRGEVLYSVDAARTYLFYGARPAWRRLARGDEGRDVRQLERNLDALGYEVAVDGDFDDDTADAVRAWEEARGVAEDGVVELGEIVFLPGPRRMGAHALEPGAPVQPGAELAETTSTGRVVTVQLEASRQTLVAAGDAVTVELPDGRTVGGRIAQVGTVAEPPENPEEGGEPTVSVEITLSGPSGRLDQAPVEVHVESERRDEVLAVPVSALLALLGGGYALEVVDEAATRLVAVETGLFANGYVQVSGPGLRAGDRVVVPR